MGLQEADTAALLAPGTPDHLVEQLERPLRGARIAIAEAEIGIEGRSSMKKADLVDALRSH